MILGIQKEIEESEKLRIESKELLENAQKNLIVQLMKLRKF